MFTTLRNVVRGKLALVTGVMIGAFVLVAPAMAEDADQEGGASSQPVFGMETEPVGGAVALKWRVVAFDIGMEQQVLVRCRAGEACPTAAKNLMDIVAEGAGRSGLARVGWINRAVDLAIAPDSDQSQWGVADRWSPPFETLNTRRGDCEDYAIVKYLALLEAGLPRDDVKIVIVRNRLANEDHAVVAARVDGQWLILDNLRLALVRDTAMFGSIPRFVLDQHGVRRLIRSNA